MSTQRNIIVMIDEEDGNVEVYTDDWMGQAKITVIMMPTSDEMEYAEKYEPDQFDDLVAFGQGQDTDPATFKARTRQFKAHLAPRTVQHYDRIVKALKEAEETK